MGVVNFWDISYKLYYREHPIMNRLVQTVTNLT